MAEVIAPLKDLIIATKGDLDVIRNVTVFVSTQTVPFVSCCIR